MAFFTRFILLSLPLIFWATSGHAIPTSYGEATHDTPSWQTLGGIGDQDTGVSWTVDNGVTWGNDELFVGQTVQFKFDVVKPNTGNHYADLLGAWVDWGQDGEFDHQADQVAYGEHIIKPTINSTPDTTSNFTFFSSDFHLTSAHVGETWLRAQVTCSHSISVNNPDDRNGDLGMDHWDSQWEDTYTQNYQSLFQPTGYYYQGETEEWKLTINEVPEPASIALLGLGLAGLVVSRKRLK